MHRQFKHWALAISLIVGSTVPLCAQESALQSALNVEQSFVSVVEKVEDSVVSIARVKNEPQFSPSALQLDPFGLDPQQLDAGGNPSGTDNLEFIPNDFGAGIIISPPGDVKSRYILTNYHVVRGGPTTQGKQKNNAEYRLFVRFSDRMGFEANIFAADPRSDLAVLQIDSDRLGFPLSELNSLEWDVENVAKKGQMVLALGNPYAIGRDGSASVSWGIISNISRRPAPQQAANPEDAASKMTLHDYGTLLHLDTRLDPGTSGGALVNLRGELVGITTSLAALEGYPKSVGFAIPVSAAIRRIISTLLRGEEVEYGFLGVRLRDMRPRERMQMSKKIQQPGAPILAAVFPQSPAHRGGFTRGDLILAVNQHAVFSQYDLMRRVSELGPGVDVQFRIWRARDQRAVELTANLGKWPVFDDEAIVAPNLQNPFWRGIRVDYPTGRERYIRQPFVYQAAVVIIDVADGSIAQKAGLKPGDFISHVDGHAVELPSQFYREVQKVDQKTVALNVVGRDQPVKISSK